MLSVFKKFLIVDKLSICMTEYAIWRHEGGMKKKQEQYGTFDDEDEAREKCSELNANKRPSGARWGYQVHPE
jgi:hypothetical protein